MRNPLSVAAEHWLYARRLKSADELTLPHFLGIGAQKAGTTWLYENLRRHPDVFMPEIKEVHYFDSNFDRSLSEYAAIFRDAGFRLRGEITPAYSIIPIERIRYIRTVMPELRLIFLMRNPIERAWSHAVMILVTHAGRRYEDVRDDEFCEHLASGANQNRGDYLSILETWTGVFPRNQLFAGFFEDIAQRPIGLLQEICRHLGLSQPIDWERFPYRRKVYAGPGIPMPAKIERFLRDLYQPKINQLEKRVGARALNWLDSNRMVH